MGRAPEILYCFVFLPTFSPFLGDFVWCDRVAERFIRHIIGFCLLLVRIRNKPLSVPKSELCFICVRGRRWGVSPIWIKHVLKGISFVTRTVWYQAIGVLCFISLQFSLGAILHCFVFLLALSPILGDFVWCHSVAERFIRHIIGFCLLLVRILNKLLSVPKSELCLICVRGRSWGIYPIWTGTCW